MISRPEADLGVDLYTEQFVMNSLSCRSEQVRFRTEKSLFSGHFDAIFLARGAANQTLQSVQEKGNVGLVR
jgi:hypothetical protein